LDPLLADQPFKSSQVILATLWKLLCRCGRIRRLASRSAASNPAKEKHLLTKKRNASVEANCKRKKYKIGVNSQDAKVASAYSSEGEDRRLFWRDSLIPSGISPSLPADGSESSSMREAILFETLSAFHEIGRRGFDVWMFEER
jgi:hypothetical protein